MGACLSWWCMRLVLGEFGVFVVSLVGLVWVLFGFVIEVGWLVIPGWCTVFSGFVFGWCGVNVGCLGW